MSLAGTSAMLYWPRGLVLTSTHVMVQIMERCDRSHQEEGSRRRHRGQVGYRGCSERINQREGRERSGLGAQVLFSPKGRVQTVIQVSVSGLVEP